MRKQSNVMKKKLLVVAGVVSLCAVVGGCGNKQIFDTTYSYERAIISLPNGDIIDGPVQSWTDYQDGDQIQVKIGGKQYLVHSTNVALISE